MSTPRLGLALGSGSARGWAHIGILRALEERGLKPDVVTGASVGVHDAPKESATDNIVSFNDHYASEYRLLWLSCLDESMNSWLNKFCPGFMSLPRKPHPFGNEYHSIADGDGGRPIM